MVLACGFDLLFRFNLCCERNFWPMVYMQTGAHSAHCRDTARMIHAHDTEQKKNSEYEITLIYDFDYTAANNCFLPLFCFLRSPLSSDLSTIRLESNLEKARIGILCQVQIFCDVGTINSIDMRGHHLNPFEWHSICLRTHLWKKKNLDVANERRTYLSALDFEFHVIFACCFSIFPLFPTVSIAAIANFFAGIQ